MQKQWFESNGIFLNFVGVKYGQSVRASLETGRIIVTEVDEKLLPKFKTANDEKTYLESLAYWQQKEYKAALDNYRYFSCIIRRNLSAVYGVMYSMCRDSLRSHLIVEPDYQSMVSQKRFNSMTLCRLVRKICNGSTSMVGGLVEIAILCTQFMLVFFVK